MKGTLSEKALRYSEEFVRALWAQDMDICRPYLAAGFTFIGPSADEYCLSDQALMSYFSYVSFDAFQDKKISEDYFQVRAESDRAVLVCGHVLASYSTAPKQFVSYRFRLTCLWTMEDDKLKLLHLHISTPTWQSRQKATDGRGDEVAVQHAPLMHAPSQPLVMRDSSGIAHFLEADAVVYLEAERQYTMVHTTEGIFRLAKVLGKAAAELPPCFLRVHRGFVINVSHVREIHTRTILLDDGTSIPMPERRSVQVRKDVENAIRALGTL